MVHNQVNESCSKHDAAMVNHHSGYQREKPASQYMTTLQSEGQSTSCTTVRKWVYIDVN